jgi:rare lipoprotein A (peptidoglycan hydrolase)
MWRKVTVILMSMSVLVCLAVVKDVNAATNFFGSSTFTPLFLDVGFLGRAVNLDLPEVNVNLSFSETDIPDAGVLTIITEIPSGQPSSLGHEVKSDTVKLYWQTNAPKSPETTLLTIYTDKCSDLSEYDCAFEQSLMGKNTLINLTDVNDKSATARVSMNSSVRLVYIPKQEPIVEDPGYMTEGVASWYAYKGCNCAASPDFPKGSYVKVTRTNDPTKSVIVRINDYGPERDIFPDRVIDLDKVAFQKIAPVGAGLTHVMVEPVDTPPTPIATTPAPEPETVSELAWEY